jgi:Sec-independent protein secretion pathway component TatC
LIRDADQPPTMSDTGGFVRGAYDLLDAARENLVTVLVTFLLGLVSTVLFLRLYLFDKIQEQTLARAVAQGYEVETSFVNPFEVILLQAKIGVIAGVLITVPVVVYLARDSLKRRGVWFPSSSRTRVAGFLVGVGALFALGVAYAYLVMIPYIMQFVAAIAVRAGVRPFFRISSFIDFVLVYSVIFGVAAQLPLVMVFTVRSGVVSYSFYRDKWRHFVLVAAVVSALVTSPDPMTQVVVLGPLVAVYFLGLGAVRVFAGERLDETTSVPDDQPDEEGVTGGTPPSSATAEGAKAATRSAAEAGVDAVMDRGLIDVAGAVFADMRSHSKRLGAVFLVVASVTFYWLIYHGIAAIRRQTVSQMPPELAAQVDTVQLEIFEFVFLVVKYSALAGALATIPFVVYYSRETLVSEGVIGGDGSPIYYVSRASVVVSLFLAGAAYAYYGTIPVLISVLSNSIVESGMEATFTVGEFIDFVFIVTVLVGVMAEMPAAMYFLVSSKLVRYETLKSKWKHFTVVVFVVGALVTSPDPFTMIVVATPLSGFYLVSLATTRVLCHGTIKRVRDERRQLGLAEESD